MKPMHERVFTNFMKKTYYEKIHMSFKNIAPKHTYL